MPLPDSVAIYIAGRIKSNIRELEGSLIRLIAYASLTGRELSVDLAQEVLRNVKDYEEKAVTIDHIQKFMSEYYQLKLADLEVAEQLQINRDAASGRHVSVQSADTCLAAGDWTKLWRKAPFDGHSLHSKGRESLRKQDAQFNTLLNSFLESFR